MISSCFSSSSLSLSGSIGVSSNSSHTSRSVITVYVFKSELSTSIVSSEPDFRLFGILSLLSKATYTVPFPSTYHALCEFGAAGKSCPVFSLYFSLSNLYICLSETSSSFTPATTDSHATILYFIVPSFKNLFSVSLCFAAPEIICKVVKYPLVSDCTFDTYIFISDSIVSLLLNTLLALAEPIAFSLVDTIIITTVKIIVTTIVMSSVIREIPFLFFELPLLSFLVHIHFPLFKINTNSVI